MAGINHTRVLKHAGNEDLFWKLTCIFILLLLVFPVFSILLEIDLDFFSRMSDALTADYTLNTLFLVFGVSLITLSIGVSTAWLITRYKFPLSAFFQWILILPLAFPAYIMAYTYKGLLGLYGTTHAYLGWYIEIDNLWGLLIILSLSLFPYVFLTSRVAFTLISSKYLHSAFALGSSEWRMFQRIALPLGWPVIFGGILLVIMEVLNNYGAVHYFGIQTFTTEIVRQWNPVEKGSIANIASILILFLLIIFSLEHRFRKGAGFEEIIGIRSLEIKKKSKFSVLLTLLCSIPFVLGFLIPFVQLMAWSKDKWGIILETGMVDTIINTFFMGISSAILAVLGVLFIRFYIQHGSGNRLVRKLNWMAHFGYAIPGALLGVGILSLIFQLNKLFTFSLTSSLWLLIFAYVVRFYSVSMSSVNGGFDKLSPNLGLASFSIGGGFANTLFRVHSPILKRAIAAAVILVFVDVIKELPLTMMFQRFNFQTLAVSSFKLMETDGAIYDAAFPSLLIVLISIIPVFFMDKLLK